MTVTVDNIPLVDGAYAYVIWDGACKGLTPTVSAVKDAAGTAIIGSKSSVTINVPTTGNAITCVANIPLTQVFDTSQAAQVPLGPTSCINFGYTAVGTTPAPTKTFGIGHNVLGDGLDQLDQPVSPLLLIQIVYLN